jgi:alpha-1,2-mannosyltransferase
MAAQALGSVRVAAEALGQLAPALWVDTTGWAFPYPLARLAGCRVAAYVHYPTVSTDMLDRVRGRLAGPTHDAQLAASLPLTAAKLVYYHALAAVYGACGGCAQVAMANSSWTRRHVAAVWWARRRPALVFPPCDTADLAALPLDRRLKRLYVLSVAQFRPEKDHALQLRAFAAARARAPRHPDPRVGDALLSARLQLVGGCRGAGDEARVAALRRLAAELGLDEGAVEFRLNVPFAELRALLGDAVAGLHTMEDEHFGISVVEYMAAGVVPIAHDSGGPREDIVVPEAAAPGGGGGGGGPPQRTGFRCTGVDEYCEALVEVLGMEQAERQRVAAAARRRAAAFSDARFQAEFVVCLEPLLPRPPRHAP